MHILWQITLFKIITIFKLLSQVNFGQICTEITIWDRNSAINSPIECATFEIPGKCRRQSMIFSQGEKHVGNERIRWTFKLVTENEMDDIAYRARQNTRRWQKYIRVSRILVKRQKYPTKQTEGGTPNVYASREFYAGRRCSILRPCFKSIPNLIRNLTDQ